MPSHLKQESAHQQETTRESASVPLRPKRWQKFDPVQPSHLARFPKLNPLIVQVLCNRDVSDPQDVEEFLSGRWSEDDPFAMQDMRRAVDILIRAIIRKEPIAVYGDFDADGVAATALLVQTLKGLGADVRPYIPNRVDEGYGLKIDALRKLYKQKVRLVVTVDCGIRAVDEITQARRGLEFIVTDHHSVGPDLPFASAVINPKRKDCPYPFKELAAVGVAFKLAQALIREAPAGKIPVHVEEHSLLDLVAVGTVADIVPLLGENRTLVKRGLERLNNSPRPGIRALAESANLQGEIGAWTIGFVIGPRINAAGRLKNPMLAYRLLMARDQAEASHYADELNQLNRERQRLTLEATELARSQVVDETGGVAHLLFAASPDFKVGIVGLVASRLTEEFHRPSVVLARGEEESRASCRSIPEFHITRALDECSDLLVRRGGHKMAAGFTVRNENLPALQEQLQAIARRELAEGDLIPKLKIDAEVDLSEMNWATHALLEQLEPFGYANPTPLLLSREVFVHDAREVGERHLKMTLSDGRTVWDAIAFRQGGWAGKLPRRIDVVYTLEVNEWNEQKRLQLNVKDLRPVI